MSRKKKRGGRILWLILLVALSVAAYYAYTRIMAPVRLSGRSYIYLYVTPGETPAEIAADLKSSEAIKDDRAFLWLAEKMQLGANIHPGRYRIRNGMSMRHIVNLIRYGKEEKVRLNVNHQLFTLDAFAEYADEKLMLKEGELMKWFRDAEWLRSNFGLSPESAFGVLVPGTYEVSWAIDSSDLMEMFRERYNRFWNRNRMAGLKESGLTREEAVILASIVQSESSLREEQEKIAGVYVNRLKKGMMLQADPTLRFANQAFDARRFWDADKRTDSPYNTYRYKGLPPGPVCIVYPQAVDATLNYKKHRYIYFCAKPSLNGYSDFSETYSQHERYAAAYRRAMNAKGISR